MNRSLRFATALALIALGCSASTAESPFIEGFAPVAEDTGYTRYVTPVIPEIKPGEDVMYCQWVSAASDIDQQVVDVTGQQSKYGHHIVLYATATKAPVGTSRKCLDTDMLSVRFIGGIGGEGATAIRLPEGYSYRVPKGFALMANVHYINVGREPIQGQGVVDIKLKAQDESTKSADIMTNLDTSLTVPPGASKLDVDCKFEKDMNVIMWANHVHEWGSSVASELRREDGTVVKLTAEDPWEKEMTYNPRFKSFSPEAPMVFRKGDTIHTHCEWNNTTNDTLPFGPEMCVGIAFYVTDANTTGMQVCDKGVWSIQ